ncbi:hypothetical protein FACS1894142_5690 [Spirochaetia bacterium]|nr:hypothetical protein FACS1894142_5690 [Spirochaetia bacterium]
MKNEVPQTSGLPLPNLTTAEECRECRNCCVFRPQSLRYAPKVLKLIKQPDGDYVCSYRDLENGCQAGSNKPFLCSAWPFSIAKLGDGRLALILEYSCPVAPAKPLADIRRFAWETLSDKLYDHAQRFPDTIRDYDGESVILRVYQG